MKPQMRRCVACGWYTLKKQCHKCSKDTMSAHPAKFSPDDKYMRYRLMERYSSAAATTANV